MRKTERAPRQRPLPNKLFFRIGEVCKHTGIEAHVLRYWESEFPQLAPAKDRNGQRLYRPRDIRLIERIRDLLYQEEFTIAGARRKLAGGAASPGDFAEGQMELPTEAPDPARRVNELRSKVVSVLALLQKNDRVVKG